LSSAEQTYTGLLNPSEMSSRSKQKEIVIKKNNIKLIKIEEYLVKYSVQAVPRQVKSQDLILLGVLFF
tara:strand:- start:329 stop:532 length:204 start_codon:yes stop_codon:yes gene_type:complete